MRRLKILLIIVLLVLLTVVPGLLQASAELPTTPALEESKKFAPEPMDWRICAAATGGVILVGVILVVWGGIRHDHRGDGWGMYK
ncbi:hypothetical protein ACFL0Z_01380 [Patescibacteria group bacterium]